MEKAAAAQKKRASFRGSKVRLIEQQVELATGGEEERTAILEHTRWTGEDAKVSAKLVGFHLGWEYTGGERTYGMQCCLEMQCCMEMMVRISSLNCYYLSQIFSLTYSNSLKVL